MRPGHPHKVGAELRLLRWIHKAYGETSDEMTAFRGVDLASEDVYPDHPTCSSRTTSGPLASGPVFKGGRHHGLRGGPRTKRLFALVRP